MTRPRRLAATLLVPVAAALAAAAALLAPQVGAARADEFSLTISAFDADLRLDHDAGGHAVLAVRETIDADFPDHDANHGLERAIPLDYDRHPLDLGIVSVVDGAGEPLEYSRSDEDGFAVLRIGSPDAYVHGAKRYVISYTMRDVVHEPDDAAIDEFFWDVNGTGWSAPMERVRATVHLGESAAVSANGDLACYTGPEGATTPCASLEQPDAATVVATAGPLGAYENLTIAIGFADGAFVPYDRSLLASPLGLLGALGALGSVGALIAATRLRVRRWADAPGRGAVVAQYEPDPEVSVLLAAELLGVRGRGVAATILELAVAGHLRIADDGSGGYLLFRGDEEPPDGDSLRVFRALFGRDAEPGARRRLGGGDGTAALLLADLVRSLPGRALTKGLRRTLPAEPRSRLRLVAFVGFLVSIGGAVFAAVDQRGGALPLVLVAVAAVAGIATGWLSRGRTPLTEAGRAARDHLDGLREYVRLAEADRLRVLQSPDGALRADDVLRLNERLLPYALLFGQAAQWQRELAAAYGAAGAAPAWFDGAGSLDVDRFSARTASAFPAGYAVSTSSGSSSSWSGSSSFSSSSGSSGGGSSGGGGGGGGGGGW